MQRRGELRNENSVTGGLSFDLGLLYPSSLESLSSSEEESVDFLKRFLRFFFDEVFETSTGAGGGISVLEESEVMTSEFAEVVELDSD